MASLWVMVIVFATSPNREWITSETRHHKLPWHVEIMGIYIQAIILGA